MCSLAFAKLRRTREPPKKRLPSILILQAYQVLKRGGLDDDHIVVFHTNDLAGNFMNPHPGEVFNKPGGPDVYAGVPLVRLVVFCWLQLLALRMEP